MTFANCLKKIGYNMKNLKDLGLVNDISFAANKLKCTWDLNYEQIQVKKKE